MERLGLGEHPLGDRSEEEWDEELEWALRSSLVLSVSALDFRIFLVL